MKKHQQSDLILTWHSVTHQILCVQRGKQIPKEFTWGAGISFCKNWSHHFAAVVSRCFTALLLTETELSPQDLSCTSAAVGTARSMSFHGLSLIEVSSSANTANTAHTILFTAEIYFMPFTQLQVSSGMSYRLGFLIRMVPSSKRCCFLNFHVRFSCGCYSGQGMSTTCSIASAQGICDLVTIQDILIFRTKSTALLVLAASPHQF